MRTLSLVLALALVPAAHAQYTVTGGQPTSAQQVAAAGGASALPTDDPMGFHLNPALVAGQRNGFTVGGAVTPQNLFSGDPRLEAVIGFGGEAVAAGVPLRVGAGLSLARYTDDLELRFSPSETSRFERAETNVALGLGAETVGPLRIALGATARAIDASSAFDGDSRTRHGGLAADLGVLATADLAALSGLAPEAASGVVPVAQLSAGYAARNLGASQTVLFPVGRGEVWERESPLPREAALGWGMRLGADMNTSVGRLPLVHVSFDLESNGLMLAFDIEEQDYAYTGPLGSVRIGDALIGRGRVDETSCGPRCTTQEFSSGHRALSVEALGAARVTFGQRNYGEGLRESAWGFGVEPLALINAIGALAGRAGPVVRSPVDVRFGYARLLMDPGQTLPLNEGSDAFTLTLGWAR